MKQIDVDTLRDWLENGRPVTVLDIRNSEDRAQWSIPGSMHLNAYAALKSGDPKALLQVELPADRPVVTICNAGVVSQVAAEQLSQRGMDAAALAGGMKSWSLAWNTAELPLGDVTVVQVRRTGKGCLSYLLASDSQAVVIDASLNPTVYLHLAGQRGWAIRYVLDTHVHADHLSRSRALAEMTGAALLLPRQNRVRFAFQAFQDGDTLAFGNATLRAIATPGHTDESTSYLVNGQALFTGDTLFLATVGRPDLKASRTEAEDRARTLFQSLRHLLELSGPTIVFPGHASEPPAFDTRPICDELGRVSSRIGAWLRSEDAFVRTILDRIPPTPPNYLKIVELNETGALPEGDVTDLEAGANRCAVAY
ncbi:MAG TPA: MBL fold metallo-hydrolase [Bryobacteraceae bacterium]|jgi:glyoxylase-like metal-dependent hydrolase (beta-lactamase superfamily II)